MPDDGQRYELVQGRLVTMPPPGNSRGKRTMRLGWRLAQHVETNHLGIVYAAETGFQLASDPDTVRGIDIAFVSQAPLDEIGEVAALPEHTGVTDVAFAPDGNTLATACGDGTVRLRRAASFAEADATDRSTVGRR
jgi:WD40 repeat protein